MKNKNKNKNKQSPLKFFTGLALTLMASTALHAQETTKFAKSITLAYFSLPPHVIASYDDFNPRGASIEYFQQEIAKRLQVNVKWTRQPLTRAVQSVKEGKIDGIISIGKNSKRAEFLLYPETPFHYIESAMIVLQDDPLNEITGFNDISHRKILIIKGWLQSPFIAKYKNKLNLEYIFGDDTAHRLATMLLKRRSSMVYSPIVSTLIYRFNEMGKKEQIKILALPEEENYSSGLYTVFSMKTGKELLEKYNKINSQLATEQGGSYAKYLKKYVE